MSGEIRYLFGGAGSANYRGSTSASFRARLIRLQYDMVFHPRPEKRARTTLRLAGGGIKVFRGPAPKSIPSLMQYGYLTRTSEWKPMMASVAASVSLGDAFHRPSRLPNQITRFPPKVIAPAPGLTLEVGYST